MKLLLDQGAPRAAADVLGATGYDAVHVGEAGMSRADDTGILAFARADHRTVVTLDADFHRHLAASGARAPSVIRVRIEGLRAQPLVDVLVPVQERLHAAIETGAAVSIFSGTARARLLPIGGGNAT